MLERERAMLERQRLEHQRDGGKGYPAPPHTAQESARYPAAAEPSDMDRYQPAADRERYPAGTDTDGYPPAADADGYPRSDAQSSFGVDTLRVQQWAPGLQVF